MRMRFRHRYEVDPQYIAALESHGMVFSGKAPDYPIMQILELTPEKHPYFVGTQAHPELSSRPLRPHPMFVGLVRTAKDVVAERARAAAEQSQGSAQAVPLPGAL